MRSCEQTQELSVLEHGISVARYYKELYQHIHEGKELSHEWKLPEWVYDERIKATLLPLKDVLRYQIYHDCGKPFCVYTDDNGKRHFPDHAEISWKIWTQLFPNDDIAWLIRHDMDIHLAKADDVERIASTKYWSTQLLCGLAELHSNADMFGGIESTSFKIKFKALNKTAKRILNIIKNY